MTAEVGLRATKENPNQTPKLLVMKISSSSRLCLGKNSSLCAGLEGQVAVNERKVRKRVSVTSVTVK